MCVEYAPEMSPVHQAFEVQWHVEVNGQMCIWELRPIRYDGCAPQYFFDVATGDPNLYNIHVGAYIREITDASERGLDGDTKGNQELGERSVDGQVRVLLLEIAKPVEVTRAESGPITATLAPDVLVPDKVEWVFTGGAGGTKDTTPTLATSVVLVDGDNQYSVECRVTINGVVCKDSVPITLIPRSGPDWEIVPSCTEDLHLNFGEFPGLVTLGELNTSSHAIERVIEPVSGGFELERVDDPNGPNDGYYFVDSASLAIEMHTDINKHLKAGAVPDDPPGISWREYNAAPPRNLDTARFLEAVKGHEYRGVGGSGDGHFAKLQRKESEPGMDARTAIEPKYDANDDVALRTEVQSVIDTVNNAIYGAADAEPTSNWSGTWWYYDIYGGSPAGSAPTWAPRTRQF
jgi:hypothetical protein